MIFFYFFIISVSSNEAFDKRVREQPHNTQFFESTNKPTTLSNYVSFIQHSPEWNPKIEVYKFDNNLGLVTKRSVKAGETILTNRYPYTLNSLDIRYIRGFSKFANEFIARIPQSLIQRKELYLQTAYLLSEIENIFERFDLLWLHYEIENYKPPLSDWEDEEAKKYLQGSCFERAEELDRNFDISAFEYFESSIISYPDLFKKPITFEEFIKIKTIVLRKTYDSVGAIATVVFGGIDIARHLDTPNAEVVINCPDFSQFVCYASLIAKVDIFEGTEIFVSKQSGIYDPNELLNLYNSVDSSEDSVTIQCNIEEYFPTEKLNDRKLGFLLFVALKYSVPTTFANFIPFTSNSITPSLLKLARIHSLGEDLVSTNEEDIFEVLEGRRDHFSITSELNAVYLATQAVYKRMKEYPFYPNVDTLLDDDSLSLYTKLALKIRSQEIKVFTATIKLLEEYWMSFVV